MRMLKQLIHWDKKGVIMFTYQLSSLIKWSVRVVQKMVKYKTHINNINIVLKRLIYIYGEHYFS